MSALRRAAAAARCAALGLALARCGGGQATPDPGDDLAVWKAKAEEVRELRFERPVELVSIEPNDVPALIRREISRDFTPEKARAYSDAYAALGLLPPGLDLFGLLVGVYGEQLAGLYDPREERLYVRSGTSPGGYSTDVVAVHELVHALEHQHFPATLGVQFGLEHDDDLSTMLSVVTEGDASLAAFALSPSHGRSPAALAPVHDAMMKQIDEANGAYTDAPRPIRMRLVVPYAEGLRLAAEKHEEGGNAALDAWLRDPPLSTLALVNPAAADRPVDFVRLPLQWLSQELTLRECRLGHYDTVGPLMIGALFEENQKPQSADVAQGWSGDRLVHASCAQGSEIFWYTRWISAQAAASFAGAYLEIAPIIAARAHLTAVPRVALSDRTVLVRTPLFEEFGARLESRLEVKSYDRFTAWLADACFPENACPVLPSR